MKKYLYLAILPLIMLVPMLSSCSNDDDDALDGFDYPAETLYGTWKITKVGTMDWPYQTTTATFNSDGTYYGRGYFGTGDGTYTAKGKKISCYVNGELYCEYEVKSLSATTAVLNMSAANDDSSSLTITCEKQ